MIRMIACDLDDTLFRNDGYISNLTLQALAMCAKKGAKVVICTGRMVESTRKWARLIGVNAPCVVFNGGMIYDFGQEKALYAQAIPNKLARQVLAFAEDMGIYIQACAENAFYCEKRTGHTIAYETRLGITAVETGRLLSESFSEDAVKLLAIDTPERIDAAQEKFIRAFPDVSFVKSKPHYLEIFMKNCSKSRALLKLADMLGIEKDEIAAFGDGENDLDMLHAVGHGRAMGASPAAKDGELVSIRPFREDGVALELFDWLKQGKIGG